jgi:RHS repeat-associated protein
VQPFPPPAITDFNPKSGNQGTLVTVAGSNFAPFAGAVPQITLSKQGGGTIAAPLSSFANTGLSFVIPTGAATGAVTVLVGSQTGTSSASLTIAPSNSFTLSAAPPSADLVQGQSVAYAVTLNSGNGFTQLATLGITGLPAGVTATFKPQSITAGQTALLTVTAPASQPVGLANLTVSASATVDGLALSQTSSVQANIIGPTTSFTGRAVVDDPLQTPIAGVSTTMLGTNGAGGTTGCTGTGRSDAAGNFLLQNLSNNCTGPQLIGFDGTTATAPSGKYAGVNVTYTLTSGQVTAAPLLVHLPRIDNLETFNVQQNAVTDQTYAFQTIPGLSVTVYAGTTFTMPDGTKPNPFPLTAVSVPVDRLPDVKPPVPTMISAFIVAFQPANVTASRPVAVYYPNTINTAPGVNMTLMTLDPTKGTMVPYGTGTVAADGTQIVPDPDPNYSGARYGIVHFDWHGGMAPPPTLARDPPPNSPCPTCQCVDGKACTPQPVYFSSGVETIKNTDISFGGSRGTISLVRSYRTLSNNTTNSPFGTGGSHNYGYTLDSLTPGTAALINLVAPDYHFFPFSRQPDGTLKNTTDPAMLGAVMTTAGNSVSLRWKDGTVLSFTAPGNVFPLLQSITDSNGNTTSLTRNGVQITKITDPVGRSLVLTYDGANRITSITDPIGRTVLYTYNSFGTVATVTDPAGGVTRYDYANAQQLTRETDPRGVVVMENTYDANGRVIQQKQADGGITTMAYTLANPLAPTSPVISTVATDPLVRQTTYRYSTQSYLTNTTDPVGQARTFGRSVQNLMIAATGNGQCAGCGNPAGGDTSSTYDSIGNQLSQTDALGNTTQYTYEPTFNKVATITDPLGSVTRFAYDSRGNLISQTDANNHTTTYAYDQLGQLTQVTDALGQSTKFTYDSFGNLITVTDPLQSQTQFRYDAVSRQTDVIDPLGRRTATSYDYLDRVVKQTDAKGGVTAFQYDAVGNLLSLTDARGKKTTFTYDGMNRLLTRTTPLGKADSRTYDSNGNLIKFIDRRGQASTFAYDQLDRLVTETYQDSTVSRQYDAAGRLVRVDDSAGGTFTYQYDSAGRLAGSATPLGTVQYARDALGRVQTRHVVGQPAVTYAYDPAGNLLSAAMPQASVTYSYNARNQPSALSRTNGVGTQYSYDPAGRLLAIAHARGATPLVTLNYANDAAGQRTSIQNTTAQALTTQPATATYDDGNRLLTRGTASYTYDDNGNLLTQTDSSGTTAYTWDARNRLISITAPNGQITTLLYDPSRNLVQQKDVGPTTNLTQAFVLDELTNIAFQSRSDGDESSILTGQSIDEHLAMVHANGQVAYAVSDALDSTIATSDAAGSITSTFAYEPFGSKSTLSGSDYPFSFNGRTSAGGLYYLRNRFLDPTTSRFVSEDPSDFMSGDVNLYSYVSNSPVDAMDPVGLSGWVDKGEKFWEDRANSAADQGNLGLAFLYESVAIDILAARLVNPWFDAANALTDPCLSKPQRIAGVLNPLFDEWLNAMQTAHRWYRGLGLDRSTYMKDVWALHKRLKDLADINHLKDLGGQIKRMWF